MSGYILNSSFCVFRMAMRRKRRSLQSRKIPKRTKIWGGDQQEPGSTSATGECGAAGVHAMVMDSMMCGWSFRGYRVKPKQMCFHRSKMVMAVIK